MIGQWASCRKWSNLTHIYAEHASQSPICNSLVLRDVLAVLDSAFFRRGDSWCSFCRSHCICCVCAHLYSHEYLVVQSFGSLSGVTILQAVMYYRRYADDWWVYRYSVSRHSFKDTKAEIYEIGRDPLVCSLTYISHGDYYLLSFTGPSRLFMSLYVLTPCISFWSNFSVI